MVQFPVDLETLIEAIRGPMGADAGPDVTARKTFLELEWFQYIDYIKFSSPVHPSH